jgi:hypothetical protein
METRILGSINGVLAAGLTPLMLPGSGGAVLLVGMAAGAFYGSVSGGLLGAAIGGIVEISII